jgi:hypothetical protein
MTAPSVPTPFPNAHSQPWITLTSAALLCATLALAACGGGGGDDGDAGVDESRLTLAAAPALPAGAEPVPALTYSCGNVTLGSARSGEIEVPAGQVCVLQGTYVDGNIKLNRGSVLDARDVTVIGNVQAEGAASVLLAGASSLTGSVQIKQGRRATIVGARIDGDLQFDANSDALLAAGNQVAGNIQVVGNRGGVRLDENRANGNLQCKENLPAPRGSGNTAASIEDQCRDMLPAEGSSPGEPANPPVAPLPPSGDTTLPAATFASGSNVVCRNASLAAQDYANVEVPAGARCELKGTRLSGNLKLGAGASVDVRNVVAAGNLQGDGTGTVTVSGGRFDGSVQLERGQAATLTGTTVGGSVQLERNAGLLWLQDLRVRGDLQLFDNRGGAALNGNVLDGNLQCKGNLPPPGGSGNRAASKEDQCSVL